MSQQARQPSQKDAGKLLHLGTQQIKRLLKQYRKHDTKGWRLIKAIRHRDDGKHCQRGSGSGGANNSRRGQNGDDPECGGTLVSPIGKMAGVQLPIIPLRGQMFTTNPLKEIPADLPFVIDFSKSLYFHREGQGLLVGMSNQGCFDA